MKKLLYVTHNQKDYGDGVWKKIEAQVDAFIGKGLEVDFIYREGCFCHVDSITVKNTAKMMHKFLFYWEAAKLIFKSYDVVYARKPHGGLYSIFFLFLLKRLKRINPEVNIIMEIPTYPYKSEINSKLDIISEFFFDLSKRFFLQFVDKITFMGYSETDIWGKKSFNISNGINLKNNKLIVHVPQSEFVFVGVANLAFWHGYDRVIDGILKYSGDRKVLFYIVGPENEEFSNLKRMACDDDRIIFTGKLMDEKLTNVLARADVCIDAIGRHRSGNNFNSSIKSKEYAAKGLPFIKSHIDSSFGDEEFILNVPADESPIDIDAVIKWRSNLSSEFSLRERKYAEDNLSWGSQFAFIDNLEKS